jgi:hypothetical protein
MTNPMDVADGALQVVLADLESVSSTLLPICVDYGAELSAADLEDRAGEYRHLALFERGDVPEGVSFEFLPDAASRFSLLSPGPIPQQNFTTLVRILYRDPTTQPDKLTETPQSLEVFISALTTAVVDLFDPRTLAPTGVWTLPVGTGVYCPQIIEVDMATEELSRGVRITSTELTLTCWNLG